MFIFWPLHRSGWKYKFDGEQLTAIIYSCGIGRVYLSSVLGKKREYERLSLGYLTLEVWKRKE